MIFSCNKTVPVEEKQNAKPILFVKHIEGQLIGIDEEPLFLKGTNLGNWLVPEGYMFKTGDVSSPTKIDAMLKEMIGPDKTNAFWHQHLETYIQKEDILYLKKIGCNHIRLPFHYRLFTSEPYLGTVDAGFTYLDRVINWCKEAEMYVLLDMHCAPGGQSGDNIDDSYGYPFLFDNEASKSLMLNVWKRIAYRYKNEPIVLGYDIMNEPIAHYFEKDRAHLEAELVKLYDRAIEAIREIDANHLIFVNGSMWSTNFAIFDPVFEDDKIVYEFHKYKMPPVQAEVQAYVDFREKNKVPIYVGETGENTDEWVLQFRQLLESNHINWCFWPYKKMNNPKGVMNFKEPEVYHYISDYAKANRSSYHNIRDHRPPKDSVKRALKEYLKNAQFKNCFPNEGYCKGLGLRP